MQQAYRWKSNDLCNNAAFVPKDSLIPLEKSINNIVNEFYKDRSTFNKSKILTLLNPAYLNMVNHGVEYDLEELFRLLYITGIFYFRYRDNSGKAKHIYHQYHRGNRRPSEKGEVIIHLAVAKAFS